MLGRLPALWAIERGGLPVSVLQPKDSVRQITPRPLLVIGGTRDNVVPAFMARALYAAAREPKQLLLVEGAGHGRYESADPVGYPGQLVAFFERALLAANDPKPSEWADLHETTSRTP
jgi:fermentation-respiration switch protein FrsA (DUF1100 family)